MLTIRASQPSDQPFIWTLHYRALEAVGANKGVGPWDDDLKDIESAYWKQGGAFLVGVYQGQIVAMGGLRRLSERAAEVTRMRVDPRYQRQGFGTQILQTLEQRARDFGYLTLRLDTTVRQVAAQRLYAKQGFQEVCRTGDGDFTTVIMEKSLEPPGMRQKLR